MRDISARRDGRGGQSEIRNKNNTSLPASYIKSYGNRSSSIGLSPTPGVSTHFPADVQGSVQKAAPFTPYLGTPQGPTNR